jgi:ATP-binding protein involved in chromosome partitioning
MEGFVEASPSRAFRDGVGTFLFKLRHRPSTAPVDGFAFLVQNVSSHIVQPRNLPLQEKLKMPPAPTPQPAKLPIEGVKNLVAVASGKGGVGKTTVAVNLSLALRRLGASVGLLDADVYGPNVPIMLGTDEQPQALSERQILPVEAQGVKLISMGLLNPGDKPMIWRGPMLHSVMQQFLRSVVWGELDYLIVDLPPGTGDVQLSLIQMVPVTGAVLVTTPSVVALADVRKAIEMFRQVNVDILGIVENMSFFNCPHCQGQIDVFGHGEGRRIADTYGVPLLGEIEIDPRIRIGGDTGEPVALLGENAPEAKSIYAMARAVASRLEAKPAAARGSIVEID